IERDLISTQFSGEHYLPYLKDSRINWRFYLNNSKKIEPDYRRIIYARDIGDNGPFAAVLGFQANLKNGGRFFSNLNDKSRGLSLDFKTKFYSAKVKIGFSYEYAKRDFASRLISVIINASGNGLTDFSLLYLPPDRIFNPENFRRNGFSIGEYVNGTNNYSASEKIFASYVMTDLPLNIFDREFSLISGLRLENASQTINSMDNSGLVPIYNQNKNLDLLPSLNLLYKFNENTNLRVSYSQTLNRPELRELAPFAYFDFATQTSLKGNPDLKRSFIRNFDLRIENFPAPGKLISASVFYKNISNAIEKVVVTGSALGSERTFINSDKAEIYGFEIEGRISFGFIYEYLENLSINGNYTRIKSLVNVKGTETTIPRENRPLQGQSPYVINLGLFFIEPTIMTSLTLTYNKIGERIVEVATAYQDDVIEKPRDILDFKLTQYLFRGLSLNFSIKDILAKDVQFVQENLPARIIKTNSTYSLGLNYKLN
ncbi:MAG: TonB-dependent receptor domain-containing protein, partial [Ignavibacteria bacterium]